MQSCFLEPYDHDWHAEQKEILDQMILLFISYDIKLSIIIIHQHVAAVAQCCMRFKWFLLLQYVLGRNTF